MAVIGAGSSAIQIVPGIQPTVKHIDHYVRGKTWISPTFAADKVKERGKGLDNCSYPVFLVSDMLVSC
jgi:cation diffusion facilitator CzcD-associated flavoprotein CzcO